MLSRLFNYLRSWLTSPARWLSATGRLAGLTLPARVMFILLIFLILCVVGFYVGRYYTTDEATFGSLFEARFVLPLLVCVIALPVTAYYATRFWLETPPSEFPDIDDAWQQGIASLGRAGLDVHQLPLYFTLGVTDATTADHVMQAAGWELLVDGVPDGVSPLRWYASKKAVMLFLLDAGSTSKMHRLPDQSNLLVPADLRGTLLGAAAAPEATAPSRGIRGTIVSSDNRGGAEGTPSFTSGSTAAGASSGIKGTMLVGGSGDSGVAAGSGSGSASAAPPTIDRQERILQSQRMARVCELASGTRLPLCPLNGVLAVVDWNVLLGSREGQLSAALRADYEAVVGAAHIYVPMIMLINGLDIDSGFIELARRVGEERAKNNRFGHGFSHLISPTHEQMAALASHAAGAFEDWIYDLFKHPDSLERSNNEKLFSLLVKTRNELRPRLAELLSGLANDGSPTRGAMLAGCYFGATGKNNTRQAFVRSVIDKLIELEDDIEWTEVAIAAENRLQSLIRIIIFINALLIVFILSVVAYAFMSK